MDFSVIAGVTMMPRASHVIVRVIGNLSIETMPRVFVDVGFFTCRRGFACGHGVSSGTPLRGYPSHAYGAGPSL